MRGLHLAFIVLLLSSSAMLAQETSRLDIALGYNFAHTNAPPAGCGCFSMNGGNGAVAWHVNQQFSMVAEVGAIHASDVPSAGQDLTLVTYMAGPRFAFVRKSPASSRVIRSPHSPNCFLAPHTPVPH
jgi:peptidoglycan-associated lipoprotein